MAESVETVGQLAELQGLGADFAQGHHLARPAPADVVDRVLAADLRPPRAR